MTNIEAMSKKNPTALRLERSQCYMILNAAIRRCGPESEEAKITIAYIAELETYMKTRGISLN